MDYRTYPAPAQLAHVVRFYWTVRSDATGDAPHRLTAETCPNLVLITHGGFTEADGNPAPQAHLAGALRSPADMVAHGPFRLIGVYLWPWATTVLFDRSPAETMGRIIALNACAPEAARSLAPALSATTDTDQALALVTTFLTARIDPSRTVEPPLIATIKQVLESPMDRSVHALVAASGLARRQFERRFTELTGLPPALFLRIARFQRTYRMLENGTASSLTEVAHTSGYFDQSHFIREFKRFSGLNPRSYFVNAPDKADNFVRLP